MDGGPKGAEGGIETVVFPAENERKYAAGSVFFFFFLWETLCYSQSGDQPKEYLAKFGYKLNMTVIF